MTIGRAILRIRPGAQFSVTGEEYDGIEWFGDAQTKPTRQEVEDSLAVIAAQDAALAYQNQRMMEYPDFRIYLDAIVKGDQEQLQGYIDACLAVKAKYPKP
jgi:hypothetical protein